VVEREGAATAAGKKSTRSTKVPDQKYASWGKFRQRVRKRAGANNLCAEVSRGFPQCGKLIVGFGFSFAINCGKSFNYEYLTGRRLID